MKRYYYFTRNERYQIYSLKQVYIQNLIVFIQMISCSLLICSIALPNVAAYSVPLDYLSKKSISPELGSADWYYERALVSFEFERYSDVEHDISEALKKQPDFPEAYYLLGVTQENQKKFIKAMESFRQTLKVSSKKHIPAQLRLIYILQKLKKYIDAAQQVEELLRQVHIRGEEVASKRIQLQILLLNSQTNKREIFFLVDQLIDRIKIFLQDSFDNYYSVTFDRGLTDGLVCLEFIGLVCSQEIQNNEIEKFFGNILSIRHGFCPLVYLQIGEIAEHQNKLSEAISNFDRAVSQMRWLSFSEVNGDYSAQHFRELQQKISK